MKSRTIACAIPFMRWSNAFMTSVFVFEVMCSMETLSAAKKEKRRQKSESLSERWCISPNHPKRPRNKSACGVRIKYWHIWFVHSSSWYSTVDILKNIRINCDAAQQNTPYAQSNSIGYKWVDLNGTKNNVEGLFWGLQNIFYISDKWKYTTDATSF